MERVIQLQTGANNNGRFFIEENNKRIAELDFEMDGDIINAYHTGVRHEFEGQGIAAQLVDKLVDFAREKHLQVIPTCSYIFAKFSHSPSKYKDVWHRHADEPTGNSCGLKRKSD